MANNDAYFYSAINDIYGCLKDATGLIRDLSERLQLLDAKFKLELSAICATNSDDHEDINERIAANAVGLDHIEATLIRHGIEVLPDVAEEEDRAVLPGKLAAIEHLRQWAPAQASDDSGWPIAYDALSDELDRMETRALNEARDPNAK